MDPTTEALPEQLISRTMLRSFTPVSDTTLFRWIRQGNFPTPIRMGAKGRARYWKISELRDWLSRQRAVATVPITRSPAPAAA